MCGGTNGKLLEPAERQQRNVFVRRSEGVAAHLSRAKTTTPNTTLTGEKRLLLVWRTTEQEIQQGGREQVQSARGKPFRVEGDGREQLVVWRRAAKILRKVCRSAVPGGLFHT